MRSFSPKFERSGPGHRSPAYVSITVTFQGATAKAPTVSDSREESTRAVPPFVTIRRRTPSTTQCLISQTQPPAGWHSSRTGRPTARWMAICFRGFAQVSFRSLPQIYAARAREGPRSEQAARVRGLVRKGRLGSGCPKADLSFFFWSPKISEIRARARQPASVKMKGSVGAPRPTHPRHLPQHARGAIGAITEAAGDGVWT